MVVSLQEEGQQVAGLFVKVNDAIVKIFLTSKHRIIMLAACSLVYGFFKKSMMYGFNYNSSNKNICNISERVTHWFTLIMLSALRRFDNENMLSTMNLKHMCYKDSILQAGNHVKEILLKLNLTDHRSILMDSKSIKVKEFQRSFRHSDIKRLSQSDEVLKLKNFKKDASLKLSSYQIKKDLVYQVENKNSKKNNDMCYPRFTKVIIDYFMSKDQSISRRNKTFWHNARDDLMFNMIRVISKHQDIHVYGAILPDVLTNQEMLDSKAYKEYYVVASGAVPTKAKIKYKKKTDKLVTSLKSKTTSASKGICGKTLSSTSTNPLTQEKANPSNTKELQWL
nr:hypothetical protein [Tanacetum cinerariifolium]